jgi:hypothetical protein
MSIIKNLNLSVKALEKAITDLKEEAEHYYASGDNRRGNIRYDAAARLQSDLKQLIIGRDYITLSLKK